MAVAIVTGASMGLGAALAHELVRSGWSVVIDARDEVALEAAAHRLRGGTDLGSHVKPVAGDITDPDHRARLVAAAVALGGLDLIVNNASTLGPSPLPALTDYPLDGLRGALETNLVAPLALIQSAAALLARSHRPRVINITSDASVEAYPGWGGYGATKAALDHLSAVLAAEQPGWRVWSVDPGDLRTRMHQEAFPGEDISDRPEPATVVPTLMAVIDSDRPSGRIRLADVAEGADVADVAAAADLAPTGGGR